LGGHEKAGGGAGLARVAAVAATGLLLAACGGSSTSTRTSPHPATSSPASSSSASPVPTAALMVVFVRTKNSNPPQATVELIEAGGKVAAKADFSPPANPFIVGCVPITPPAVRIAAGAVFFADNTGAIHRLDPNGSSSTVASFAITQDQFLSFAVSPDGLKLAAIVFSTPPVVNRTPEFGVDPYAPSGQWTLDLESAIANGPTTKVLHKDFGHTFPSTGPTLIAGWDDNGLLATVNSSVCVQNAIPSVEYTGNPLIHLGSDGTHLDSIGGSACAAWDELPDGTVLCGGSDWNSFSVRTLGGSQLWSRGDGLMQEPRLSPNAAGVSVNGDKTQIFLRDKSTPTSVTAASSSIYLLGWFGNDEVLVLKGGQKLGLVPVASPSTFKDLGVSVSPACSGCLPVPVTLIGTLGNP
jgi:hypothetical protein